MRIGSWMLAGACWGLALAAALGVGSVETKAEPAQEAAVGASGEPPKPLADRARAVLETYCAECREVGAANGGALSLGALAEDPRLVTPKAPDASRIYRRLLASQAPPPVSETKPSAGKAEPPSPVPPVPHPTPAEIETVRDWIDSLPARDEACRERTIISPKDTEAVIDRWATAVGRAEAADTRFVSLVHLWNACVPAARLKELREAAASLITALSRRAKPLEIETLGEESAILAFRLSEFERPPGGQDVLAEPAPDVGGAELIPADWLAAQALSAADALGLKLDGAAHRAVADLARFWTRDVDLVRAAAERGTTPRDLMRQLAKLEGDLVYPARKITYATLSRDVWSRFARVLAGEAAPETVKALAPQSETEIDVLLWPDQPAYAPRDLVTLNVSVDRACHLTLIGIDPDGKALVLFPSELEQENLIAPRVTVQVPGRDAGYQLRFDRSGEEKFVAICQRNSRRPDGIAYDYERQRFAILGDWRAFVRATPEREKAIEAREAADAARRKRRGRSAAAEAEPPPVDPSGPAIEGRAAIVVRIDQAGGP
ncbi:DUF4384 domain-containing protein [Hyphomicrobium sp. LHD-15]|uniref:DUF4384 domain-containing protein n=1 Tax=Hyphomicrobium sp. LHD-15 TaxID=3072142 RepID=UPI00280E587C|nr:DUF4384 domain-containing protein [Hyphomicrobium sp. LHD-15]MDQ8697504.1 DUF4384 domain-containing protein [Hyphomicrobium sp. LHD-15]